MYYIARAEICKDYYYWVRKKLAFFLFLHLLMNSWGLVLFLRPNNNEILADETKQFHWRFPSLSFEHNHSLLTTKGDSCALCVSNPNTQRNPNKDLNVYMHIYTFFFVVVRNTEVREIDRYNFYIYILIVV